ncbi:hypothetical protein [Poriferisphaera sp. WC338]|uniref:hypothetical protein n=1 Tax=Poriferisphaera sp. WC338 TaxID=3425129 RepID=UPI003D819AC5
MRLLPRQIKGLLSTIAVMCLLCAVGIVCASYYWPVTIPNINQFVKTQSQLDSISGEKLFSLSDMRALWQKPFQQTIYDKPVKKKVVRPPSIKLLGTSVLGEKLQAFAVDSKGQTVFLGIGDTIGQATVTEIKKDAIEIEFDQQKHVISMGGQ